MRTGIIASLFASSLTLFWASAAEPSSCQLTRNPEEIAEGINLALREQAINPVICIDNPVANFNPAIEGVKLACYQAGENIALSVVTHSVGFIAARIQATGDTFAAAPLVEALAKQLGWPEPVASALRETTEMLRTGKQGLILRAGCFALINIEESRLHLVIVLSGTL